MMLNVHELNVELAKIKGDIKMINAHIEIIKTNHWGVGFLMVTQMLIVIREFILI